MNQYEVIHSIAEGSFGRVYKARCKISGEIIALKLITKFKKTMEEINSLRKECEIQKNLNHPNIIKMLNSFETEHEIVLVTEFAYSDLHDLMRKRNFILSEDSARRIIIDLIASLHYLHSNRILHRDLKPQNVLLMKDGTAKLCDFGFARNLSLKTHVLTSVKGTPLYMAPELMEEDPVYDQNADLWSLGCIAYEMLVGNALFNPGSIPELVKLVKTKSIVIPDNLTVNCRSFLEGLLEKNPEKRLCWPHLLEHPFLEGHTFRLPVPDVSTAPLTAELTASQAKEKELQKQSCSRKESTSQIQLNKNEVIFLKNMESNANYSEQNTDNDLESKFSNISLSDDMLSSLNETISGEYEEKSIVDLEKCWKDCMNWDEESNLLPEEWMVFLQQSMEEVMSGDVESLMEPSYVSMLIRGLCSNDAIVIEYVVILFSLPFSFTEILQSTNAMIKIVYYEANLVPKLFFCSRSLVQSVDPDNNINAEQLQALEIIFVLLSNLCHSDSGYFLDQLITTIDCLKGVDFLIKLISLRRRKIRLAVDIFAILSHILRIFPERWLTVEQFIDKLETPEAEMRSMLSSWSELLRKRILTFIKMVTIHLPHLLFTFWTDLLQNDIEALTNDTDDDLNAMAVDTMNYIKKSTFYIQPC